MYQKVAVIEKNPVACVITFYARRYFADSLQLLAYLIGNRLPLSGIRDRADHEEIGERGDFAQV